MGGRSRLDAGIAAGGTARIRLFGTTRVDFRERTLGPGDFGSRKAKQVLEILALARAVPVPKDRLIDLIWGDQLPLRPGAALEHCVSLLRSALGCEGHLPLILTVTGGYQLDPGRVEIDLDEFDELVEGAARQSPAEAIDLLERALVLAAGEVLEDEPYAEWTLETKDEYQDRVQRALLDAARLALLSDQPERALVHGRRAIHSARLASEEAFYLTASALQSLGRTADALAVLRDAERDVGVDLGLSLAPDTKALQASLLAPEQAGSGQVTLDVGLRLQNPPKEIPFVGRDDELAAIGGFTRQVAEGGSGFVLVEGQAGIGKTRLLKFCGDLSPPAATVSVACSPIERQIPRLVATRLYRLLSAVAGNKDQPPPLTAHGDEATSELFAEMTEVVRRLEPLVVLVDDIHWADQASICLFEALTFAGMETRTGFIATFTPRLAPADHAVWALRPTLRIRLEPLGPKALEQLGLPDGLRLTGGYPTELSAYFEAITDGGTISDRAAVKILAHCDEAGPLCRQALTTAAALEQPFGLDDLAYILGLARSTTADCLDRALTLRLIRIVDDRFEFAGELTRRVLLATIPTHRASLIRALAARTAPSLSA